MAYFVSYSDPAPAGRNWPDESRTLMHLLRSAAATSPEAFKSLHGNHPVDVFQSKEAYELRTDAPGLSSDDIIVEVHEDVLKITAGAIKPSNGTKDTTPAAPPHPPTAAASEQSWKAVRRERSDTKAWTRAFLLPEDADVEKLSVRLDRGQLTLHVPLCPPPPKAQPRRFTVNSV